MRGFFARAGHALGRLIVSLGYGGGAEAQSVVCLSTEPMTSTVCAAVAIGSSSFGTEPFVSAMMTAPVTSSIGVEPMLAKIGVKPESC